MKINKINKKIKVSFFRIYCNVCRFSKKYCCLLFDQNFDAIQTQILRFGDLWYDENQRYAVESERTLKPFRFPITDIEGNFIYDEIELK